MLKNESYLIFGFKHDAAISHKETLYNMTQGNQKLAVVILGYKRHL